MVIEALMLKISIDRYTHTKNMILIRSHTVCFLENYLPTLPLRKGYYEIAQSMR